MRKKTIVLLSLMLIGLFMLFTPVYAEETTSTEQETTEFTLTKVGVYQYTKSDTEYMIVTLYNDNTAQVDLVEDTETSTYRANYTLESDVLTLNLESGVTTFSISGDTLTPISVEENEEVTASDRMSDFIDKWIPSILSFIFGAAGSGLILAIASRLIKKLTQKVTSSALESAEERKKNLEELNKVKELQNQAKDNLDNYVGQIKEIIPNMEEEFKNMLADIVSQNANLSETVASQMKELATLKELVALLVSSTPELASNGYATKIIKLLGTGAKVGVTDEQTK